MEHLPGREPESAALADACRDVAGGRGRLVLLTGEAGIGKSRLADAVAEEAAGLGFAVGRGWCVDDPARPALWPWRRAARAVAGLAAAVGDAPGAGPADEAVWRLTEDVADALCSATGGVAVVLEDLHWADPSTLDLLVHLLPEVSRSPVLLVGTARDVGLAGSPLEHRLPALLRASRTLHVPVGGLGPEAVSAWLGQDARTRGWVPHAAELARATGGNPFFVRALVAELPPPAGPLTTPLAADLTTDPTTDLVPGLSAELAARPAWRTVLLAAFRGLPAEVRTTLAAAAVMGEQLTPGLLAAALDRPVEVVSDHLAAAVSAGLLRFGPAGLAFHHALVRDAVVSDLAPEARQRAEAGVAGALEATSDPLLVGPAAVHWSRVEGAAAARRCRDHAAPASAAEVLDPGRAVGLARLALRSARSLGAGQAELAERHLAVARAEWAAGMLWPALESCSLGLDLAVAAGRPELAADCALVPQGIGSVDVAVLTGAMARRALRGLPEAEVVRRARLLALCAVAAAEAAQPVGEQPGPAEDDPAPGTPAQLSEQAYATASASGDEQAELETIAARHFVLSVPQTIEERARLARRAVELGPGSSTTMGALWGSLWQADLAFQRGDVVAVEQVVADVELVARRRCSPVARWHALRLRAALDVLAGRFDAARSTAAGARALADRIGDVSMIGMHLAFQVNLALLRGDPAGVPPDFLDVIAQAPPMPLVRVAVPLVLALRGELEAARAEVTALRGVPARMPLGPRWYGTVGQIGFAAVAVGDRGLARVCRDLLLPVASWCAGDGGGSPFASGSNEQLLGLLAQTCGDRAGAAGHFGRALEVDRRLGAWPSAALDRLGLAECVEDDERDRARLLAREAAEELARLDMPGPASRARALQERLAASSGPLVRPGGLSERELEVAILVAQGMTNQQVADRLVLSVRTVESHVRSALTKLDLTSRTQVALWVRDRVP